jgi:4-hydroxyphenylpyruvate dioxygenase-like putative hemolysin
MTSAKQLDDVLFRYVEDCISRNRASTILKRQLDDIGVGIFPLADHLAIRTGNIDRRAEEFLQLGYQQAETIEYDDWYAKVYRKAGYPPLFIDQAYDGERGRTSVIPDWVRQFGDRTLHHVAVRVENIDVAIEKLQRAGVTFAGKIVGEKGGPLRQIFTVPEEVNGAPFSVLELAERRQGYEGFLPPQADGLMRSTVSARK